VCCGQDGCPRRFTCFKALRRHLAQHCNTSYTSVGASCDEFMTIEDGDNVFIADDVDTSNGGQNASSSDNFREEIVTAMLSFVCTLGSKPNMTMSNVFFLLISCKTC
jgi:hypothetical protein